ncbi:MAG: hypothetical protein HYV33_00935 [Candidatus Kerfeldbacteria bacterium]|nr:hypothetical protein [Candidatus Kerfeldbacteria bacterium]
MTIKEWEQEKSVLDQVQLWAVSQTNTRPLAITDTNAIVAYEPIGTVQQCSTGTGTHCTAMLANQDEQYFSGRPGDEIILEFDRPESNDDVSLLLFAQGRDYSAEPLMQSPDHRTPVTAPVTSKSIQVFVQLTTGLWQPLQRLHPRENWANSELLNLINLDLPADHIAIKLVWTGRHDIDWASVVTTQSVDQSKVLLPLVAAQHSQFGDVTACLLSIDHHPITLIPGQEISLQFSVPEQFDVTAALFFSSRGYYYSK